MTVLSHETALTGACVGIDPGAGGGIAVVSLDNQTSVYAVKMPRTVGDLWTLFTYLSDLNTPLFAVIEKVGGFMGGTDEEGKTKNKASAHTMFTFGAGYGSLCMALYASKIPYQEVPPITWQRALGLPSRGKGEDKGQHKNRLKAKAQQLFPKEEITLATADAILIAEYCRRKRKEHL